MEEGIGWSVGLSRFREREAQQKSVMQRENTASHPASLVSTSFGSGIRVQSPLSPFLLLSSLESRAAHVVRHVVCIKIVAAAAAAAHQNIVPYKDEGERGRERERVQLIASMRRREVVAVVLSSGTCG